MLESPRVWDSLLLQVEKRGHSDNVQWLHTFISCIKFESSTITLVCNYRRWNDILVFTSHSPCRCTFLVTSNFMMISLLLWGEEGKVTPSYTVCHKACPDIVAIESPFQLYRTHFNLHASVILEWPMSQVTLHNKHGFRTRSSWNYNQRKDWSTLLKTGCQKQNESGEVIS